MHSLADHPTARYLPFATVFGVVLSVLTQVGSRRQPPRASALEFGEAGLATFFLTRLIARERVGAPLRKPFVEPAPDADPDDTKGDAKQAAGVGVRRSIGELVTCPRCLGPWAAALLTFGRVFAPRQTSIVTRIFALAGANSLIHAGHAAAAAVANADRAEA